ncbi:MAG: hypothetical protein ABF888_08830 [Acetobacter papayae]
MVQFDFLPCDVAPRLDAVYLDIAFHAEIIYPFSYGDKRTSMQESIESRLGISETFPRVNIGEMQLGLRVGYIVNSFYIYYGRIKNELFKYEGAFESGPLVSFVMQKSESPQDDIDFKEDISIEIDREQRIVCIGFGRRANRHKVFSIADDCVIHVDENNHLVDIVFRNVQWSDLETELARPSQGPGTLRLLWSGLVRSVRRLF